MCPADDMNTLCLDDLYRRLWATGLPGRLFELARDEDLGPDARDLTSEAVQAGNRPCVARVVAREPGIACGLIMIEDLARVFGLSVRCVPRVDDGSLFVRGQTLAVLEGEIAGVLRLERTLLNLCARLCGVATLTDRFVRTIQRDASGSPARILDTRKTTPGLRVLEKYAVRCGGGLCHRMGLHDAVLIKYNHLAGLTPEQIASLVGGARARAGDRSRFFEVEVDTLAQLDALLTLPAGTIDIVLLDNMADADLCRAVQKRDQHAPTLLLEASGGVDLHSVASIARTGVDRISAGALTHHAVSLDIGLEIDP